MKQISLPSGRIIGENQPPFIIAEIGSNWITFQDCIDSIVKAKTHGADAVKFQLFTLKDLYGFDSPLTDASNYTQPHRPGEMPREWVPILAEKARAVGIEFMITAFSPEGYDFINPYVNIHKVASAEATHVRILEKLRSYGKPVILSTGAKGEGDIGMALKTLGNTPTVLMYCVAAYPADEIKLSKILDMKEKFGIEVGYSDHSTDVFVIPFMSIRLGAVVLEKHVSFIDSETPDSPHSLNGDQFKKMVDQIQRRKSEIQCGPDPGEIGMVLRHNRRLIATRDIAAGEMLKEGDNFGIYRSLKDDTKALSPFAIDEVNNMISKSHIKAGDGISTQDVTFHFST